MVINPEEVKAALHPEILENLVLKAIKWITQAFNDIIDTGKLPSNWKTAKVIGILKPGKNNRGSSSYRPLTLLNCSFKFLEQIIFSRITPVVGSFISPEKVDFRKRINTTEQVLTLTTYIELGYNQKFKTGAVFFDLSAAYDIVWQDSLILKLTRITA